MTDNVLQAFCERCGTRYTSNAPETAPAPEGGKSRFGRLGRRGQDKAEEQTPSVSTAAPSSDAFAGTFHFCMDCRQYVCAKCWNAEAGGCLSDRPPTREGESVSGDAAKASPFAASNYSTSWANRASGAGGDVDEWGRPRKPESAKSDSGDGKLVFESGQDPWRGVVFSDDERGSEPATNAAPTTKDSSPSVGLGADHGAQTPVEAWPETDRGPETKATPSEDAGSWPQTDRPPEPTAAPTVTEPVTAKPAPVAEVEPEPVAEPEPEPVAQVVPEPVAEPEPEPVAAEPVAEVQPEPAIATEPEPVPAADVEPRPEPEPEPVVQVEPEPVAEPEPEPVAQVEPEPVAEPEPEPVAQVEPEPEREPEPVAAEPVAKVQPEPAIATEPEPEPVALADSESDPEPTANVDDEALKRDAVAAHSLADDHTHDEAVQVAPEEVKEDLAPDTEEPPADAGEQDVDVEPEPEVVDEPEPGVAPGFGLAAAAILGDFTSDQRPDESKAATEPVEPAPVLPRPAPEPEPVTAVPPEPATPVAPEPPPEPLPPSPITPIETPTAPPSIEVWNTPTGSAPFEQPYQAPAAPAPPPEPATPPAQAVAPPGSPMPPTPADQPDVAPSAPVTPGPTPAAPNQPPVTPAGPPVSPPVPPPVAPAPPVVAPQPPAQAPAQIPPAQQPQQPPAGYMPPPPQPLPQQSRPRPVAKTTPGTHSCPNCGLSLSARARFCRRCGAQQG